MDKKHQVSLQDLIDFLPRNRLCGAMGTKIDAITDPIEKTVWYELFINYGLVYQGDDLTKAIKLYNEA